MTAVKRVLAYVIVTGLVAAAILALKLPSVILYVYLVIAAVGLAMQIRDLARPAASGEWDPAFDSLIAKAEEANRAAEAARRSPWFADSVVDLDAARMRAAIDGHVQLGVSLFDVPNPYLVLPAEAVVRWGFATPSQVTKAYANARNDTAPDRWHNPMLMRDLGFMGWDAIESVARIGLLLESHDRVNGAAPA